MPYHFEYDWFSPNIPVFEQHLGAYRDTPCKVLEIGTHEGRSTTWLLENILTHFDSRVVCIDMVKQSTLEDNLIASGSPWKVQIKLGRSRDVLPDLPADEYDFAYIDGSHWTCDVLEDAILVFRKIKVGGVIAFDDYLWDDPAFNQHGTPKPAVDAFLACYGHKLEVLENGYQVWVRKLGD
jgi:predicted O-methyltransferase YrrM